MLTLCSLRYEQDMLFEQINAYEIPTFQLTAVQDYFICYYDVFPHI